MKNNIKYILNKIEDNIKKHSSKEKNIKLIIVTKSQIIDDIKILINLGYKSFGENYLNEAKSKILTLSNENIEWHFIGKIQSNKVSISSLETKLSKSFIQVGIFGVENNANKTRDQMLQLNLPVNIFDFQIKGKPYWRVVAGPASTADSRKKMLKSIKSAGFTDAYYVSN